MGFPGGPDSQAVRTGFVHLGNHLAYLGRLADERKWLAGEVYSLADIAAAAHLSTVDYMGDVPWDDYSRGQGLVRARQIAPQFPPRC